MSRSIILSILVLVLVCSTFAEEAKQDQTKANGVTVESTDIGVGDMKQGGGGGGGGGSYNCGRYGCCRYGRYGCQRCCRNAEEATTFASEATAKNTESSDIGVGDMKQGGGGGGGGGGSYNCGRYGCCRYGRYGCQRCCRNAEEATTFASEATAKNTESNDIGVGDMKQGGGGGGGGSYNCGRYGCCRYGRYGCQRCCRNAEESKNFQENLAKQETKN